MGNKINPSSKQDSTDAGVSQIQQFFDNTSLHGVRYFNETSFFRKLIWFLALGACIGYCGKEVYNTISAFYKKPFSTTLTRHRVSAMDFPAVTLCNMNMISKKEYATTVKMMDFPGAHNQSDEELREEIQVFLSLFSERKLKKSYVEKFTLKLLSNAVYTERGSVLEKNLKGFSHSIEGMLSLEWLTPCMWNGKPCSPSNFTGFVNLKTGQCFTFNSGKGGHPKLQTIATGSTNGLRLKLNLEEKDHVSNDYSLESGFKVIIHDQNEYPLVEEASGFSLQAGTHTYAAVREHRFKNLPDPFKTKCASPDKPFNKYLNYSYSINACVKQCLHDYIIEKCDCQPLFNITPGVELCSMGDAIYCIYPIKLGSYPEKVTRCVNNCPEPCNYKTYETKLSYASAVSTAFSRAMSSKLITNDVSESFKAFLNKSESERQEFIRNNVVSLDVFFDELGYDIIEQKPVFNDFALLGAVGGTLGLFLGTSVLTLLEFIDFFVVYLIRGLRGKRPKSLPKDEELGNINHVTSLNLE